MRTARTCICVRPSVVAPSTRLTIVISSRANSLMRVSMSFTARRTLPKRPFGSAIWVGSSRVAIRCACLEVCCLDSEATMASDAFWAMHCAEPLLSRAPAAPSSSSSCALRSAARIALTPRDPRRINDPLRP